MPITPQLTLNFWLANQISPKSWPCPFNLLTIIRTRYEFLFNIQGNLFCINCVRWKFLYPFIFVGFFFFENSGLKYLYLLYRIQSIKYVTLCFFKICDNVYSQRAQRYVLNNTFWYKHKHISTRRLKVFLAHIEQQSTTKMIILGLISISNFMNFNSVLYWTLKQTEVFAVGVGALI